MSKNSYIEHVKQYAKDNNLSYKESMQHAKESYVKKQDEQKPLLTITKPSKKKEKLNLEDDGSSFNLDDFKRIDRPVDNIITEIKQTKTKTKKNIKQEIKEEQEQVEEQIPPPVKLHRTKSIKKVSIQTNNENLSPVIQNERALDIKPELEINESLIKPQQPPKKRPITQQPVLKVFSQDDLSLIFDD